MMKQKNYANGTKWQARGGPSYMNSYQVNLSKMFLTTIQSEKRIEICEPRYLISRLWPSVEITAHYLIPSDILS